MVIGNLIEVGVAVTDLPAASQVFEDVLGARATDSIRAPMFAMDFRMCRLESVDFELMTPYADSSVVGRFISARGEGLHHVAFQVPDLDEAVAQCRARGLPVLSDEPVLLGGLRAAFLHPRCLSGVLVEFVENLHTWSASPRSRVSPDQGIGRITGFGVTVRDVDAAASHYATVLGAEISERCWNERFGTFVRHASVSGIRFELLPATASRIARAKLDGDGQGLHHVCLQVRRPQMLAALRDQLGSTHGIAADGSFLTDPRACHGVMFELHAEPGPVARPNEQPRSAVPG